MLFQKERATKMVLWVKVVAAKPKILSSILGSHMIEVKNLVPT